MIFSDVVEVVKSLSTDEKREIQLLLQQYLREERREKMHVSFRAAQVEQQKGELKFSANVEELRQIIEE
jgi:transcriptional regulator with AAA-type ATPase domain